MTLRDFVRRLRLHVRRVAPTAFMMGLSALQLPAQGITSGALDGRVLEADAIPIGEAVVRVTSMASGAVWQVTTDEAGRYFFENLEVGVPYVVDARRIGFTPARRTGVVISLGQRHRLDIILVPVANILGDVTIAAGGRDLLNSGRTGPEHVVSAAELASLPNLTRDLSAAAALAPFAVARPLGGLSIGGQNQGYNNLQVDGGVNADLYLGRSPGGASPSGALPEVLPHAISLETVQEFQLLAAPFDVRLGNFAGGLLNAVTRSGTNTFQGSVFGFLQDGNLVGPNAIGRRVNFTTWQFGSTVAGPVIRDRVHFFLNADVQRRVVPDPGPLVTDSGRTAVTEQSARAFQEILAKYGYDGGDLSSVGRLPAHDLFGKLTMQLGARGRVELSHHYAHAVRSGFMDVGRSFDTTALSSVTGTSRSAAHTSRLIWSALLRDRAQSEVILSYQRLRDACEPVEEMPLIQVKADKGTLIAGPNSVCPTTDVQQSGLEMTGNLTMGIARHLVTMGSRAELLHFRDPLVQVSAGRWDFASLAALDSGKPIHYDRGLPAPPPREPGADFRVIALGIYAQDRWNPSSRLTLIGGLRADIFFLPDAAITNPELLERGIDTGRLPGGVLSWSPRVGLNYDVRGNGASFLRGGLGLFAGAPPYRWVGNGYRDSGDERVVNCDLAKTPPFTPRTQPEQCVDGSGVSRRISYFDRDFRFPQNLKAALGVDHRLGSGMIATLDVLYTHAVNQVYITQANLRPPTLVAWGEGGRTLYGWLDPGTRLIAPAWADTNHLVREIYRLTNRSGDNALSVSGQARRQFGGVFGVQAAYTWSRVRDRMSLVNFPARANFSNTPLDGNLEERRLRPSFFETPHKLSMSGTIGKAGRTQLTLVYLGASQPPFTYVISGDANGDGIGGPGSLKNDIVYVPRKAADINLATPGDFARLDSFIERQPCLRRQRGRIMERGSCRNGWQEFLNARLTTVVPARRGGLELTADVFNVPNLINSRWGRHRDITTGPSVILLVADRWQPAEGRWRYRVPQQLPPRGAVDDASSRWRIQLGARYFLH